MTRRARLVRLGFDALLVILIAPGFLRAQTADCNVIRTLAETARAPSDSKLLSLKESAGDSYRANLVFAWRTFQLQPKDPTRAERLLMLIPSDDDQRGVILMLGDSLCDSETVTQMESLARVRDDFAHELARAVLVVPRFLASYIRYSLLATRDPHSNYAVEMAAVCKVAHDQFVNAVRQLSATDQQNLTRSVLDPNGCRVIAVPEGNR
jgi:hypothetical protein